MTNQPSGRAKDLSLLARGGVLTLAGSVFSSMLGFVLIVVVTRSLRAEGSGVFFAAVALFTILANLTELGADTGLVRMIARYLALDRTSDIRPMLKISMWPVIAVGLLSSIIMIVFAQPLAGIFMRGANRADGVRYIQMLAPFVPMFSAMTVALAASRGFGTLKPYVFVGNVGVPLARPILIIGVVVFGFGATGMALAYGLPAAAGFAVAIVWLARLLHHAEHHGGDGSGRSVGEIASEFWRFTLPRGLAGFLLVSMAWVDVLMVGALRSTAEAGIYTAAARFIGVGTFALQAVGIAIAPQVSALLSTKNHDRAQDLFQTATWWIMAPSFPMYLAMAAYAPLLMRMFGPQFVGGQHALVILSFGLMVLVGTGNNKIVLLMGGKSALNLVTTVTAVIVNLALNFLLIPRLGIEGASIAIVATLVVDNGLTTLFLHRYLGLQPFGRGYPIVAGGAIVIYGGLGLVFHQLLGVGMGSFFAYLVVTSALYGVLLWRFRNILRLRVLRDALRRRTDGTDAAVAVGWTEGGGVA